MTLTVIVLALGRGRRAVGGAAVVLDLEGERRVRRAVGVGDRIEGQLAIGDVGRADHLAGRDVDAVELQRAVGCQRRDVDCGQRVGGESLVSLKPKSDAVSVYAVSSSVVTVLLAPAGRRDGGDRDRDGLLGESSLASQKVRPGCSRRGRRGRDGELEVVGAVVVGGRV